ncbi:MAG: 2-C-methyl-D-erythritol 4-phosphate cytidylyltransferase [Desulfovibrio sp.]|jgi:2-C-methyl-D-erythritol 4-phosphate cytidylyltransferase/2-C-methyl-D-erythritol 2,4-cyclodiphosphate synthase|nr:2-C-methyl-D-erythritol 4-phosphate cytidylyltransferase [Desulfovibrio sp.]
MNTWALLLAAGQSSRLAAQGISMPKQFLALEGFPLFWRSAMTFARLALLRGIVFVFPPGSNPVVCSSAEEGNNLPPGEEYAFLVRELDADGRLGLPWRIVLGGERRQDSVRNALEALPADCDSVLVHDAARPFATAGLMVRVLKALEAGYPAVTPGIAVADTIKSIDAAGRVLCTHERACLRAVQTPQGFALGPLRVAHARAREEGWEVTDDAELLERCGHPVVLVEGEECNRKISTVQDLRLSGFDPAFSGGNIVPHCIACTGFGYDVHRYGGERPFILGGVPIRTDVTVVAHSDGDVLLHSLMDALLGCVGGGDIGGMFPDSDPAYENISSGILLAEILERTRLAGLVVDHVDITVIAQIPRIAPHREAIAANLAKMLQLPVSAVNIKATTEEGLGFTGEKKGIKAIAVVTGRRPGAL